MVKDKKYLMWKFKWIFVKWIMSISLMISLIYFIVIGIKQLVVENKEILGTLFTYVGIGLWYIILNIYITLIVGLILFIYLNNRWVKSISANELKNITEKNIFFHELWLFIKSFFITTYFLVIHALYKYVVIDNNPNWQGFTIMLYITIPIIWLIIESGEVYNGNK